MSHEDRVYRRYGLHVVRISAYKRDGFTLLISGQDEPDQFLSSQERIPLAGDRRALVRMLRSLSDGSGLGPLHTRHLQHLQLKQSLRTAIERPGGTGRGRVRPRARARSPSGRLALGGAGINLGATGIPLGSLRNLVDG